MTTSRDDRDRLPDAGKPAASQGENLRQRAELEARERPVADPGQLTAHELSRLLHELQVHEIELEMQNEELRRAQATLEASRARFVDLYNLAPVGYLTISEKGSILEANLRAATLLGVVRSALVNAPLTRFIAAEDQDVFYCHRKQLFDDGEDQVCKLRMLPQGRPPVWVRLESSIARSGDGTGVGHITISDIDEEVRAKEEQEVLQTQLQHAQRMESVGILAGGIAHEFNNLLQGMLAIAEATRLEGDPLALESSLTDMEGLIQRGSALTRQLLLYSSQAPTTNQRLDLTDVVATQVNMLRPLMPGNILLIADDAGQPIPLDGDSGKLGQVIVNLAVNARDAMPGGGHLTIAARRAEGTAILEVTDTGTGIADDDKNRIFDPFFSTKPYGSGTGLGLAVVWGIVQEHGGRVEVESAPGAGSTFRVVLPAGAVTHQPEATVGHGVVSRGHGERVLLVEDDGGARRALTSVLGVLGYDVTALANAKQASGLAAEAQFDVVLTDYRLPGATGLELSRQLRERWPALTMVVMTGYATDDLARELVADPGLHFLQKPFDNAQLSHALRAALAGSPSAP